MRIVKTALQVALLIAAIAAVVRVGDPERLAPVAVRADVAGIARPSR